MELAKRLDVTEEKVPLVLISAVLTRRIMELMGAQNLWAFGVTLCDGIAYEYAENAKLIRREHDFEADIIACAMNISRRYMGSRRRAETLENLTTIIFDSMVEKLKEFNSLSASNTIVENPKINELRIKIAKLDEEIEVWVAKVPEASSVLMDMINKKVEKLDEERKELQTELKDLISSQNASQCDVGSITDYMSKWNELETTDKMAVVDSLIKVIRAGETTLEIEWKI
jgi:uncharacterized protein (UPF0335 family)